MGVVISIRVVAVLIVFRAIRPIRAIYIVALEL
jgi:hypothetical protein